MAYNSNIRHNDLTDHLEHAIEYAKVKAAYEVSRLIDGLINQARKINLFNKNSFNNLLSNTEQMRNLRREPQIIQDELKLWALDNAVLIKSIPDQMLDKVAKIITEGVRSRASITGLSKELTAIFRINRNRAKLIARDQVAKLNGRLTRHRNLALGITKYKWLTSRDERVRHSHDVLEGRICSWEDETVYKNQKSETWKKRSTIKGTQLHPGLDIMCRCTSMAVFT